MYGAKVSFTLLASGFSVRVQVDADPRSDPLPQDPELILTAWGVGYKFVDD